MHRRIKRFLRRSVNSYSAARAGLGPEDRRLISDIHERRLTYLSHRKLVGLATTCRSICEARLPGVFIEAGCALGGSAILMASVKSDQRPLYLYDVFETIPPPSEHDPPEVHDRYDTIVKGKSKGIGGDRYYGYEDNLYQIVESNLRSFGIDCKMQSVRLVMGLVQDTLHVDGPVALVHVDVDWYDPVNDLLDASFPEAGRGREYHSG